MSAKGEFGGGGGRRCFHAPTLLGAGEVKPIVRALIYAEKRITNNCIQLVTENIPAGDRKIIKLFYSVIFMQYASWSYDGLLLNLVAPDGGADLTNYVPVSFFFI